MKQYLDELNNIYKNGYVHDDRTSVGRKSLNGLMMRFDLSDGTVPIITTREININTLISELLWFISGSSNSKDLKALDCSIWDKWAVTEEDINRFIDNIDLEQAIVSQNEDGSHTPLSVAEAQSILLNNLSKDYLGEVGPIYGPHWRNAPISDHTHRARISITDIPSDKLKQYTKLYHEQNSIGDKVDFDQEEYEMFCNDLYHQSIDQLNELINNLKNKPYSSRHIVNCWIPEHVPYEDMDTATNVLLGKGALAPCHMFFQCFVKPPVLNTDKPKLSLLVYLRLI